MQHYDSLESRRFFAAGDLFTSFGTNGEAIFAATGQQSYASLHLLKLSDGTFVAGGTAGFGDFTTLVRVDASGTPVATFGIAGIAKSNLHYSVDGLAQGIDGNIYVAGADFPSGSSSILRFDNTGKLDSTYNISSNQITGQVTNLYANPDGSMLLVTTDGVLKFTANGKLDANFGVAGKISLPTTPSGSIDALALCITSTGNILVLGGAPGVSFNYKLCLAQYSASGVLDSTYGTNGLALSNIDANLFSKIEMVLQTGDKPVVGYTYTTTTNNQLVYHGVVARFNGKGALDSSFGSSGKAALDSSGMSTRLMSVKMRADGSLMVATIWSPIGSSALDAEGSAIYRLTVDGKRDNTFDGDGAIDGLTETGEDSARIGDLAIDGDHTLSVINGYKLATDTSTVHIRSFGGAGLNDPTYTPIDRAMPVFGALNTIPGDITTRLDGSIRVGGGINLEGLDGGVVSQYTSAGVLDPAYASAGTRVFFENFFPTAFVNFLKVLPDGSSIAAATIDQYHSATAHFALVKMLADGSIDTGFGAAGFVPFGLGDSGLLSAFTIDSNGNYVVLSSSGSLWRFTADGEVDLSMNALQLVIPGNPNLNYTLRLVPLADGGFIVANRDQTDFNNLKIGVERYDSTGKLVNSYGTAGQTFLSFGAGTSYLIDAAIDSKGRLAIVGENAGFQTVVAKLTPDGLPDTTFAPNGFITLPALPFTETTISASLMDSSDRIYVGGSYYDRNKSLEIVFTARITSGGAWDTTYGTGGYKVYNSISSPLFLGIEKLIFSSDHNLLMLIDRPLLDGEFNEGAIEKVQLEQGVEVSGVVYNDSDISGTLDAGENGLIRQVYIDLNNNSLLDAGEPSTFSSGDGTFTLSLKEVPAGSQVIRQIAPANWVADNPSIKITVGAAQPANLVFNQHFTGNGSISGIVFKDTNLNGKIDAGETPIPDATIFIDSDNDGLIGTGEIAVAASSSGKYIFKNLPGGSYRIRAFLTKAQMQTSLLGTVTLFQGQSLRSIQVGVIETPKNSISGIAFNDTNGNGVMDSGETGIPNFTVFLDANNDFKLGFNEIGVASDLTGGFFFGNLTPGSYNVRSLLLPNLTQTSPLSPIVLTLGQNATNTNVGMKPGAPVKGSIAGTAFNDANSNGVQDSGENALSGLMVYLDLNNDKLLNSGEPSQSTNATGAFKFSNLEAGSYFVRSVLSSNQTQTAPITSIALANAQDLAGALVGVNTSTVVTTGASISGVVFDDVNKDGIRQSAEKGLAGITVWLDLDGDKTIDTGERNTTTDSLGQYSFTNVSQTGSSTSTRVRAVIPAGKTQTVPTNGYGYPVDLRPNMVNPQKNFGIFTPVVALKGSIAGFLFFDTNKNGKYDTGDVLQSGKTVFIDLDGDNVLDSNETRLVTDSKGAFTFAGLSAGTYKIRRVILSGYKLTTPLRNITLTAGQTVTGVTIGTAAV